MLEIVVTKLEEDVGDSTPYVQIQICIKQTYEMILIKTENDVQVRLPSLIRPVIKFVWDLQSQNKVYKEQWNLLKESIRNKTNFKIAFNDTNGEHSINHYNGAIIFLIDTHEHGKFEHWIPIESNEYEILSMIDDIMIIYPDEPLPKSFLYPLDRFPLYFASKINDNKMQLFSTPHDIKVEFFLLPFSNGRPIYMTRTRATAVLKGLKVLSCLLSEGDTHDWEGERMSFSNGNALIQYDDGFWSSSFDIPENRFDMLIKELETVLE